VSTAQLADWHVRHEGSPQSIDNLSPSDVMQGLEEGRWESTDEVRGPDDVDWTAIENHPQFADFAANMELAPPREHDDESHVDMNALIDVCLVLLVFFILTTSYAALTKRLEAAEASADSTGMKKIVMKDALSTMVLVEVKMLNGSPVYTVEGKAVEPESLMSECQRYVSRTGKNVMLLKCDDDVPHGAGVRVQDAAKGAGITKVLWAMPK
jgi:biopolymer transport protein ExbD